MTDFSYHHISPEVHVINAFNASHCFVSQETPSPVKDKPLSLKNPNNLVWDTQNILEKVKRLSFVANMIFLKYLHIIYKKLEGY